MLTACDKSEGEGGSATIKGKVYVRDLDGNGAIKTEYYGPDRDVYIVYGESEIYNDRTSTHYDGSFIFEYLRPGRYEIFAYSECNNCTIPLIPVIVDTMIVANDDVIDVGDILVLE